MVDLPTGTVTFLFTDIEGSTRLWEEHPDAMEAALACHDLLAAEVIRQHEGHVVKHRGEGDSLFAVFDRAVDAVSAAAALQRMLHAQSWPAGIRLRVRVALHTGEPAVREGDYLGPPVNRCARLRAAAHGGQILLSAATQELVREHLPEPITLRDLGEHRLKDLARPERIFQLLHPELPSDFPSLLTLDLRPINLPAQPTPLIGREQEVEEVQHLLRGEEVRLVTLTGPGGTGKTRLGLQVAAEVLDAFADGVFLVTLAPISDPGLVITTIAQALGVRETRGQPLLQSLKEHLRDKQLLLLLDNFEQVLPAAPVVAELLAAAPKIKMLVTSRSVLHLRGEKEFPVPPLALPDRKRLPAVETLSQYAAVALFIQRARDARPDFAVTNENAPAVAEICHRLDGLPLAIELAAARIRLLPPQAMLSRLESRLKLLTGGARDLPARQQTLRNTIAWSYDLLGEAEKTLFRRLSVFVGGCTLEAADTVCNRAGDLELEVLDGIASLVEQSLLRQEAGPDGEPRFSMLETILEYGRERLAESGEEAEIRGQHARFFVTQAEVTEPQHLGPEGDAWKDRMEAELNNLRAVLTWAEEQREAAIGLRLLVTLWWFWIDRLHQRLAYEALTKLLAFPEAAERSALRGWALVLAGLLRNLLLDDYEGVHQLFEESRAIGQEVGDRRLVAEALHSQGYAASSRGDQRTADALWEQGLSIAREVNDRPLIAGLLSLLAWRAVRHGDLGKARAYLEERLAIVQEIGHRGIIANTLTGLGGLAHEEGDTARARALYEQSLAIHRETGILPNIVRPLHALGDLALDEGDLERALALHEESLALRKEINYKREIAASLARLGRVAEIMGNEEKARARYTESLHLCQEMGNREGIADCLEGMARLCILEGEREPAARLFGAAAALREAAGALLSPRERKEVEPGMTAVRTALSAAAFEAAWAEGQSMSLEQMIQNALEKAPHGA